MLQRWSDILISRAANYQPYMAYLERGGIVTTPVPSDGYMDEDQAAEQSSALGLSELIKYDDEKYAQKLISFINDKPRQKKISSNLKKMKQKMFKDNDCVELALKTLELG